MLYIPAEQYPFISLYQSVPNAASFIRPSKSLCFGISFLTALTAKYVEDVSVQEKIILGSSNGAIEVEAVGFDKVRNKLRALDRLREVSLDNEKVAGSDSPGEIRRTCPSNVFCLRLHTLFILTNDHPRYTGP